MASVDNAIADIVPEWFDASIRLGERLDNDMVAVWISPDTRMVVVGSPDYFSKHGFAKAPEELSKHSCINIRLPTHGGYLVWEFERDGKEFKIRLDGHMTFNNACTARTAAVSGAGLAYLLEDFAMDDILQGSLLTVIDNWNPSFCGYYLYYPNRRQMSSALGLLIEALRYRQTQACTRPRRPDHPAERHRCNA